MRRDDDERRFWTPWGGMRYWCGHFFVHNTGDLQAWCVESWYVA